MKKSQTNSFHDAKLLSKEIFINQPFIRSNSKNVILNMFLKTINNIKTCVVSISTFLNYDFTIKGPCENNIYDVVITYKNDDLFNNIDDTILYSFNNIYVNENTYLVSFKIPIEYKNISSDDVIKFNHYFIGNGFINFYFPSTIN
jgi:hypothetical protein